MPNVRVWNEEIGMSIKLNGTHLYYKMITQVAYIIFINLDILLPNHYLMPCRLYFPLQSQFVT